MAGRKQLLVSVVLAVACGLVFPSFPGFADTYRCDFERGMGHNAEPIGKSIPRLEFSTVSGGDMYFADITSGWYSVTSDTPSDKHDVFGEGEYFVSGYVAAYVLNRSDEGKIAFRNGLVATWVTVGYSSQFRLELDAYDRDGGYVALDSDYGEPNTLSHMHSDTGLRYITVNDPYRRIAYVVIRGQGGYWMIDNISTDAPEPSSLVAFGSGLAGLGGLVCRRRKRR